MATWQCLLAGFHPAVGHTGLVEAFGRRIAKHRAELGWTQARLAERIAVSRVALSHLEASMTVANERTVTLLAATFGVEPLELVEGTDYPMAKAERLPHVVARHTETDLQLALLSADLRWIDLLRGDNRPVDPATARAIRTCLDAWRTRLELAHRRAADPGERTRIVQALQELRRLPR